MATFEGLFRVVAQTDKATKYAPAGHLDIDLAEDEYIWLPNSVVENFEDIGPIGSDNNELQVSDWFINKEDLHRFLTDYDEDIFNYEVGEDDEDNDSPF
jgi:hypothetical protein